ncbi:hypothetical protein [Pseudomonas rubra]|uniref:Lipoprotein n=1 Tax=Pseudomonas rubra TaxID=2942627 RepID=A0ABT5PBT6_9PSED|nr:hypothetical protein [Pseudomonas rubra]MDD1015685.1 hypothetical protein [Pseudomonas rubra]MDD1040307.1 hypothetical protein [Pseudomonas rubra]MDD1153898.1 hypothetical protein [Pseudomonas rubra]
MQRLILTALCAATLVGCATPSKENIDQYIGSMLTQPLSTYSLFREGDVLSFQVSVPASAGLSDRSFQLEASCVEPNVAIMYLDADTRAYFKSPSGYAPPQPMPDRFHATLLKNPSFAAACKTQPKPDWRKLKGEEGELWVLIDRNSIRKMGNDVSLWAAFDQPSILLDLPYNAPYAQKREHHRFNCSAGTDTLLAGYDVDGNNRVTDGMVPSLPKPEPVAGSNADYQALFALACATPDKVAQLTPFTARLKAPIATGKLPPVSPSVMVALERLQLPKPVQPLKYLETVGTSTMKGRSSPMREEHFLSVDGNSQQLMVILRGNGYEAQKVTWRGLITLVSKTSYTGMNESSALTSLSFRGDWKTMAVGSKLSYSHQGATNNNVVGQYGQELKITECTVERQLPANTLNARLNGDAKALDCSVKGDKYMRVNHLFYLEDYGYFFNASTDKNAFYYSDLRLQTVN